MMQRHRPFRFLQSAGNIDELSRHLAAVGLGLVGAYDDRLVYGCGWLDHPVEIVWELSWWPDGDDQEDFRISIVYAGDVSAEVDVEGMLREKHPRALARVLIERITGACGNITAKPARE